MARILLLLTIFFLFLEQTSAITRLQLRNIGFKEGLNNMNITSIAQDQLGYIWVATMGGVSRYNGYEFKRFYFDSNNPSSLRSNHTSAVFCSSDGNIYIGTTNGIDCYDYRTENLKALFPDFKFSVVAFVEHNGYIYIATIDGLYRFRPDLDKLEKLGNQTTDRFYISSLVFDKNDNLWCGLEEGKGLAVYDIKAGKFDFYQNNLFSNSLHSNSVRTLFKTSDNLLMIGTESGISYFNISKRQYIEPSDFSILKRGLSECDIRFIMEKEPSIYWIGTLHSGLFIYDKARNTLVRHYREDGYSEINSNNYMSCLTDKSGNVWLGTFDAGLDVFFKQAKNFNFDVTLNKLTQRKFVTSVFKDQQENLIIATRENGLFTYNFKNNSSQNYTTANSKLSNLNLRTVFVDSENKYWLGIYFGLQIFDPSKKTFKTLTLPQPNNGAVSILQMLDRIYVGTDGQGILVFDLKGNLLTQYIQKGPNIPSIIKLNENEIMFISYGRGLFSMNIHNHMVQKLALADIQKYPGLLFSFTAYVDKEEKLWIGTYNYGLYAFDLRNHKVYNYNIKEGLPSSDAIGIEEDDADNLWISTSYGLAKFNKSTHKIKTYFVNEGINNYQFHGKAAYKDEKGIVYFGGNTGLTYFNPAEIIQDKGDAPRVAFENLYINDISIKPQDDGSILKKSLPVTKKITLTYKDQPFSIDFVSFDFISPDKMQYSYILEGFDKEWHNVGTQRKVFYSNMPRGNYVFKVRSVNSAGIKSENEAELMIHVLPAPWFSYFAWVIYIMILTGITYFIFRLRIKTFIYKSNLDNEQSEHIREHEINLMKQKFFSNISHELRTPLTLIYGLVSQLSRQEELSPQVKEYIQGLDLNVNRLLKLIHQLLTYKKIESESLSLWLENGDLIQEIRKVVELFTLYAREKGIRIDIIEIDSATFCFDHDILQKILSNLLSNAIKHSEKGGRIEVVVQKQSSEKIQSLYSREFNEQVREYIEIRVIDMGQGIDRKEWDTIFDRYKQVESDGKRRPDYSGTGIGLNFTKSLVELHKGGIRMKSKIDEGSTFAFFLPVDRSVFEPKDFADTVLKEDQDIQSSDNQEDYKKEESDDLMIEIDLDKSVLIVEDDPQLNNFLVTCLNKYYKTIIAHDGEMGLKMVKQHLPDIVISDIMMPKMDGFELTKSIKENKELCHIPVILLTSKTEMASQIEGMQSGADFYMAKPFNIDFLLAAIDSQLKNRKRLQDIFLNGQMPKLDKSEMNHLDIQFISKLNIFLEKELSNPELDILLLAKNMNMSRSAFYRKFVGLTKLSPNSYIKKYRINKSIDLMSQGKYLLIEISEMTGFGSSSYFSTAFKQEKGISPREFMNQHKEGALPE